MNSNTFFIFKRFKCFGWKLHSQMGMVYGYGVFFNNRNRDRDRDPTPLKEG